MRKRAKNSAHERTNGATSKEESSGAARAKLTFDFQFSDEAKTFLNYKLLRFSKPQAEMRERGEKRSHCNWAE